MHCLNCGRQTSDTVRHCEHCGFDLIHVQALLARDDRGADEERQAGLRAAADVARRCLVLCAVAAAAHDEDRSGVVAWLKAEDLWRAVSPQEKRLFRSKPASRPQRINASWKVEALKLLLWALRQVPSIDDTARADGAQLRALLPWRGATTEFTANSALRPEVEIDALRERIDDMHWAIRDAELKGRSLPAGIDPDVVLERHRAVNWLLGQGGQAWDDVTTDT